MNQSDEVLTLLRGIALLENEAEDMFTLEHAQRLLTLRSCLNSLLWDIYGERKND